MESLFGQSRQSQHRAVGIQRDRWEYLDLHRLCGDLLIWSPECTVLKCISSGEPYGNNWQAEWKYLYTLAKDQPNNGSFSFVPKPAQNGFSSWELGSVRVSSSVHQEGKR